MRKGNEWKERTLRSPLTYTALGALVGGGLGRLMANRREERFERRPLAIRLEDEDVQYDDVALGETTVEGPPESYREGGGVKERLGEAWEEGKERAASAVDEVKSRASELQSVAHEKAARARERLPSRDELRSKVRENIPSREELRWRASEVRDRASGRFQQLRAEQPFALAIGAICLGALASLLIPPTDTERRALAPAKERAREKISALGDQIQEKVEQMGESGEAEGQPEQPSVH